MQNTVDAELKNIIAATLPAAKQRAAANKWLVAACIALLVGLVFATFGRTLTTYFIADDFGEVSYVSRIAAGRWDLFWSNWTGNFMQIPGMAVYRPLLLLSLLSDYLIWKSNAYGYYQNNVLFYTGDTILIFFVTSRLTRQWDTARSTAAAFFAAALFAVSPLHCESVSWVVGRVDAASCFFSLSSILCFLRSQERASKLWLAGSIFCFVCGLLFKEMAISVPILITAIAFLTRFQKETRFSSAAFAKEIAPIWIATAIYFVIRYLALGTLTGGYTGAIGDGQGASAIRRWFDIETYGRVLLPFASSLFPANNGLANTTKLIYASALTLLTLRALKRDIPGRYLVLIAAWLFSAAVPIYKLWGVGMNLEGARFCFFLTVPLSMLLPVLLFAPSKKGTFLADKTTAWFCSMLLAGLMLVNYKTTLHSNANWVHAGKEVRFVLQAASELAAQNPNKQIVVLGVPKVKAGAHMIYNGATFKTMLEPPFVETPLSARFITFDPIFYGPDQFINSDRFRETLTRRDVAGAFVWDEKNRTFRKLTLDVRATEDVSAVQLPAGATITFPDLPECTAFSVPNVNPWLYDYVELNVRAQKAQRPFRVLLRWNGDANNLADKEVMLNDGTDTARVLVPVSHHWRWFNNGNIRSILVSAVGADLQVLGARLLPAGSLRPSVAISNVVEDGSGVYAIDQGTRIKVKAQAVPEVANVLIECSKANYFFDQIPESQQSTAVLNQLTGLGTTYDTTLPSSFLPKNQYCELRARALNAAGAPIGQYSEPVIVYLK